MTPAARPSEDRPGAARSAPTSAASFDAMWSALEPIGAATSGGYRRFAWTDADLTLREWFAGEATARGLDLTEDRAGNQWAWWGSPDDEGPGVVVGSHLDSVPDGGAFDGPLGVVCAFAALDELRRADARPDSPVGVVNFADEEGARFGVACAGSRLLTGALPPDRALALRDADGVSMAEALARAGRDPAGLSGDTDTMTRIGTFVELHIEQGRGLIDLDRPVAVGSAIRPHGRWRIELPGAANHAGTTLLADRDDPMLSLAAVVQETRSAAERHGALATVGKVRVEPNGVNAIPSLVTAWLDARAPEEQRVRDVVDDVGHAAKRLGGTLVEESWTGPAAFPTGLVGRLAGVLDDAPALDTGAGHDAGILGAAGVPAAMLFVRNPTGVSHSPAEFAERVDCLAGLQALVRVLHELVLSSAVTQ